MFDWIEFIVCFGEGLSPEEINIRKRDGELVYARQLIFYFARKYRCGSLSWVGDKYGLDHATINHSVKTIKNYIDTDKLKRARIEYYDSIINKVKQIAPKHKELESLIAPIEKQISELEQRCINLALQLAFLKNESEKLKQ
jgi:hypothetical protein